MTQTKKTEPQNPLDGEIYQKEISPAFLTLQRKIDLLSKMHDLFVSMYT